MTTSFRKDITFPVGRLLQGSLTKPQTTDADGKPLVVKSGPNAGQPSKRWFFSVGFAKNEGKPHWGNEEWGGIIWAIGHACFPQGQGQRPDFAWKITDGDSTVPNTKGVAPASREGHKGHWIVSFSSGFAPKAYNADGSAPIDPEGIKLGYYIQVAATVDGNESMQKPGMYINHSMVSLQAFGPEIHTGADPAKAGFGVGVKLPPGASTAPVGQFTPPAPLPGTPATAGSPPPPPAIPGAPAFVAPPAAPTAVAPAPGFVPAPVGPAAPPPPPAAKSLTGKAAAEAPGVTYAQFVAQGWNDAQLIAAGYLLAV